MHESDSLMSEQPPAKWPSCLEELYGNDGVVVKNLHSIFRFKNLLKTFRGIFKSSEAELDSVFVFGQEE